MNNLNPKRTEINQEGRSRILKSLQVLATATLILTLAAVVLLPYSRTSASPEVTNVVPTDPLTKVKTIDTSNFVTSAVDDDTIDYTPVIDYLGPDSFEYEICDSNGDCDVAVVTIDVTAKLPVALASKSDTLQTLPLSAQIVAANTPTANDDSFKVEVNTAAAPTYANINVLGNDDFGTDGPGTEQIRTGVDCTLGSNAGDCTGPSHGNLVVSDGPRSPDPAGITYISPGEGSVVAPLPLSSGSLLISDSEIDENPFHQPEGVDHLGAVDYAGFNLFETDRTGSLLNTLTTLADPPSYKDPPLTFSEEPSGVAYNYKNKKLYFTDDNINKLFELNAGTDGEFNTMDDILREFDMAIIGSLDPSGVTIDTSRGAYGHVMVVDEGFKFGGDGEVYDIDLVDDKLDQSDPWTSFDVFSMGILNPEAIEFNPDNCSLFILSSKTFDFLMAETTLDGRLLRYLDTTDVNARNPSGVAYAPASSGPPTNKHLYISARGYDNDPDPYANDGKVYEASFDPNTPPAVDAGLDQLIMYPNDANLDGTVIHGCDPNIPGVTTTWNVIDKPLGSTVIFGDSSAVDTTASFSETGTYVLQLEANDGLLSSSDQVTINVTLESNTPPEVDAGPNQSITLPACADLDGTVNDDGLPLPPDLTQSWSVVGTPPGNVTFGDFTAVDTTACFSAPGLYVLRLTADDSELTASDTVQIVVKSEATTEVWLPVVFKNH